MPRGIKSSPICLKKNYSRKIGFIISYVENIGTILDKSKGCVWDSNSFYKRIARHWEMLLKLYIFLEMLCFQQKFKLY